MSSFTVGTRGSALALWQTRHVNERVTAALTEAGQPVVRIEVKIVTTKGDVDQSERLAGKLEKGFFTAELEAELRAGTIDWAVHSLKDLPTRLADDLPVVAVLKRARPSDLLLVRHEAFEERGPEVLPLREGSSVGSSSLRREAMTKKLGPTLEAKPLRGNVTTRVQKLRSGQYDAILLAAAGVERLGLDLTGLKVFELNPTRWPPAPGQGAVAVQARADHGAVKALMARINHLPTAVATERERSFLRVLEGGCTTPFGCYVNGEHAHLGLETKTGWRTARIGLPHGEQPLPLAFINTSLDALASAPESEKRNDDWFYRPF